jgi:hypothetical protein
MFIQYYDHASIIGIWAVAGAFMAILPAHGLALDAGYYRSHDCPSQLVWPPPFTRSQLTKR